MGLRPPIRQAALGLRTGRIRCRDLCATGAGTVHRRIEDYRNAPYGGPRQRRTEDRDGRRTTQVVGAPPMSEAETGAAEKLRPEADRAWHRGTDAKAKPAHERTTCTRHDVGVGTDCSFLVFSPSGWGLSTRGL